MPTAPRRPPVRLSRQAVRRSACVGVFTLVVLLGWTLHLARKAVLSERAATAAAHASAVRLVRLAMELQSELDAQEDHDRWTLQLYLRLEKETMPALQRELNGAVQACPDQSRARAHKALAGFGEEAHRHSAAMLQALQRQGARARKRSGELAQSVLAQAKADRERLRALGRGDAAVWQDADLEGPLVALSRSLRRPNATFELDEPTMHKWEEAAAEALREGGSGGTDTQLVRRLSTLVTAAPLPLNDRTRNAVFSGDSGHASKAFVHLLQRARMHRHAAELRTALSAWEKHESPIWDVIELIEALRARHVFPMAMLQLAEHEWDQIVDEASVHSGRPSFVRGRPTERLEPDARRAVPSQPFTPATPGLI